MSRRLVWLVLLWLTSVAACGDKQASVPECVRNGQCDDEVFCNGEERCVMGVCERGPLVDCDDGIDCTSDVCDESLWACRHDPPDADADDHADATCRDKAGRALGDDCDDADSVRHPGAIENCDRNSVDEDCDPATVGAVDEDGDGAVSAKCCNTGPDFTQCGPDCDDSREGTSPRAIELCDGVDNDCDLRIDEGVIGMLFVDRDGDGYGMTGRAVESCFSIEGFAARDGDCDDDDAAVHPGAVDVCDSAARDQDCNGVPNDFPGGCGCEPGSMRSCPFPGRCADGVLACIGDTWSELCSITPQPEECNELDDDCDGETDEGASVTCYVDTDGDGHAGAGSAMVSLCPSAQRPERGGCPEGYTDLAPFGVAVDCAPDDPLHGPGAPETCDGLDEDCDGEIDEGLPTVARYMDADGDGYPGTEVQRCATDPRSAEQASDCMDDHPLVYPGQAGLFAVPACAEAKQPCLASQDDLWHCRDATNQSCTAELPLAQWDYDCSGEATGPAPVTAPCGSGECASGCGQSGFAVAGNPVCGTAQPYQTCRCLGAQGGGCSGSMETRPFPCG